jgi:hypothetical protein
LPTDHLLEHRFDPTEDVGELVLVRQRRDPKVIPVTRVETRARRDEHVLLFEQLQREGLVSERRQLLAIDADERVHRSTRLYEVKIAAAGDRIDDSLARLIEAATGRA